jgi:hypothetical protein
MSVGPLSGLAGSMAGSPLAQVKGSDLERAQQDSGAQERRVQGELKAESAAGIGETDGEDHETGERDADGRLPWRVPARQKPDQAHDAPSAEPSVKDPTGQSGSLLDLSG